MIKRTLLAMGVGSILALGSVGAQAAPMALDGGLAGAPPIENVIGGDGCGPNGIRGRSGFCRPLRRGGGYGGGGYRRGYGGGPRYYAPRPRRERRPGIYFRL